MTLVSDVNRPQWWEPEFDDSVVFLFLGRIHKKKGVSELIDAWKLCRSDHADFRKRARLVFAGWVDSDPELERALEKVADGLNVQYVGPQRGLERDRTYHSSRLFIIPSFSEGLPMAVLEAWAAGVPALMTRECNLPEGFESGAAVEILNEPTALAQSLQSAFSMPMDMYKKMKDASLDLVSRKYSKHSVVSRFIAVYRDSRS